MDIGLWVATVSRWIHIGAVIAAIGGAFFMRFVLIPAATAALADDAHQRLREDVLRRWRRIVHACIALLLLSGGYNVYYAIAVQGRPPRYHMVFGLKFLLALGVFFIASALVGRSPAFEGLRRASRRWVGVLLLLAALIVALSGILKNFLSTP